MRYNHSNFFSDFSDPIMGYCLDSTEDTSGYDFSPIFLNGELEAARASNVSLFVAQKIKAPSKKKKLTASQKKRVGLLIITNFRLSFVVFEEHDKNDKSNSNKKTVSHQENNFLGRYDITLSNMDEIYAYTDKKHKLVSPQQKNGSKIDAIRIVCKNFRTLTFNFQDSEVGKGKHIADALVQFAFPTRHNLLFMYHFKEKYYNASRSIRTFRENTDWIQELERCGISYQNGAWRVLSLENPQSDNALPQHFVVPKHLTDSEYFKICESFRCKRAAIWVWSLGEASLVRMADLLPDLLNNPKEVTPSKESLMLEHIRKCSELKSAPRYLELTKGLPSVQDVQSSYVKMRALCAPVSDRELTEQDEKFLTLLDKTCWLLYASLCLKTANEAAGYLRAGESVAIQENDGRDMCCLVSSLVQILLDPFYRTITGLQVLIQKEWVALGHPFSDRMGHVYSKQADRSPIFLLFLDCVWQILQQFPESFEFSETFLTTIWDAVFMPIFDTFQFNCEYDRLVAVKEENLLSRPVWDWGETFTDKDIALFSNPLYKKPPMSELDLEHHRKSKLPPSALKLPCMDILPIKPQPKQRFSLQPGANKSIDLDAKLLLPSQILNYHPEPTKAEKLNSTSESTQDKFLEPSHLIRDLDMFAQCYFRWMPILEIRNGGSVQIDLYNRMILANIHKLQRSLETGNVGDDLQIDTKKVDDPPPAPTATANGKHTRVPVVDSFFPFSITDGDEDNSNLNEILIFSSDILTEGSVFELD